MNIYWFKVNSVHLSSARRIGPNSWVFESLATSGYFPAICLLCSKFLSFTVLHSQLIDLISSWTQVAAVYYKTSNGKYDEIGVILNFVSGYGRI